MCIQHVVQHNICQHSFSNKLWPLLQDLEASSKHILHNLSAPGDPVICYSLLRSDLSSTVGLGEDEGLIIQ